jgi:hypothetical protein
MGGGGWGLGAGGWGLGAGSRFFFILYFRFFLMYPDYRVFLGSLFLCKVSLDAVIDR